MQLVDGGAPTTDWAAAWWSRAACSGASPEIFFPEPGRLGHRAPRAAVALCSGCPVLAECLNAAMNDPTLVGIWAATTERERDRARAFRGRSQVRMPADPLVATGAS